MERSQSQASHLVLMPDRLSNCHGPVATHWLYLKYLETSSPLPLSQFHLPSSGLTMPLPSDEHILTTANDLIGALQNLFGNRHDKGIRPAHARGQLVKGTFFPTSEAAEISSAPHFDKSNNPSTEVIARFSSSTGIPEIPDTDPNANPRGFAIRFQLGDDENGRRRHTDIVSHSAPGFPTHTGAEFLEFLRAVKETQEIAQDPNAAHPFPIEKFLGSHPAALHYVQIPKPSPTSFARQAYFGVTAFKFTNNEGTVKFGRYLIVPQQGTEFVDEATLKTKDKDYLFHELTERLPKGRKGKIVFHIKLQVANEGDVTDDATVHWPEDRKLVNLGELTLDELVPGEEEVKKGEVEKNENTEEQKKIIFDPIPRVKGVEASDDPLLELRAAIYLISGRARRAAP
jgi:catalase